MKRGSPGLSISSVKSCRVQRSNSSLYSNGVLVCVQVLIHNDDKYIYIYIPRVGHRGHDQQAYTHTGTATLSPITPAFRITEQCPQHFQSLREIPRKFSDFMKPPSETVISRYDKTLVISRNNWLHTLTVTYTPWETCNARWGWREGSVCRTAVSAQNDSVDTRW